MTRPRMLGLLGAFLSLSIYSTAQEKPAEIRLTIKYDGRIVPNPGHITVNSKNYVASVAVTNGKFTVPIEISRAKTWSFAVVVLGNQMQMLDLSQSELKYEDWTLCLADHHFNEECIHALPKDTDVRSSCVLVLDSERIDPGLTILQRPCRRRKKLVSQPVNAEEARAPLPKVVSASVPFYPRLAPSARIQGAVTLRLSTDGK